MNGAVPPVTLTVKWVGIPTSSVAEVSRSPVVGRAWTWSPTGVEVADPPRPSVTVTVSEKFPEDWGVHCRLEVFALVHPLGRPEYLPSIPASPPDEVVPSRTSSPTSVLAVLAVKLTERGGSTVKFQVAFAFRPSGSSRWATTRYEPLYIVVQWRSDEFCDGQSAGKPVNE